MNMDIYNLLRKKVEKVINSGKREDLYYIKPHLIIQSNAIKKTVIVYIDKFNYKLFQYKQIPLTGKLNEELKLKYPKLYIQLQEKNYNYDEVTKDIYKYIMDIE